MNERWTRGIRHAVLFLLVPALGACAVGRLSDRIVIDVGTQVTDDQGSPIIAGAPGDFLKTDSLLGGEGLKLLPGDVLTYTRWSPGLAEAAILSRHTHEPTSDRHQISLRLIPADGHLASEEARFLSTILTTQRKNWKDAFGNDPTSGVVAVSEVMDRNQVHLWNALVQNIVLMRLEREIPGSENLSRMLVAAIRMEALCNAIEKNADVQLFARAFLNPTAQDCGSGPGRASELTNPPEFPLSPLFAAATASRTSSDLHPYFSTSSQAYVQFNFAEVERNGVRVDRRDGSEAKWTLHEWEQAGICKTQESGGAAPVIRRIRLTGGRRKIWIHRGPGDPSPTYRLQLRLSQSTSSRWLERISDKTLFNDYAVLDQTALHILRMADVDFVEWGAPDVKGRHGREAVSVRPNGCRFLNAD